ncbi:FKBP-type peptidyl-prolyl cis-trans isomerase [Methanoregula sp.]|uniref:FKBP-type peptidyl-prolyl cis-trans isomerase n=1 Tax=Methanoregula sp. TaxID=2052170 RepID=UPI002CCBD153|nr:FKBP-type peptidyl-prolyl cis-trans isomerase [Methanoregula sp.]HVP95887.1 FKBP-type peptidyl-prolyl cis-trans isomerase [Methanoregula sp.]
MSDPEPVKEEITEQAAAPVEETTAAETAGSPVPDDGTKKKRMTRLILAGVAVIVILAVAGAWLSFSGPAAVKGDTVAIYYTEAFENGTVFISNMNTTTPLVFTLGNSSVISGVQNAVTGMRAGETKIVNLMYTDAYGAYDPGLVQTLNRTGPLANTSFAPGELFTIHYKTTNAISTVKILNVTDTTITWDANNPLAGQNLTFTIRLAEILHANTTANATAAA